MNSTRTIFNQDLPSYTAVGGKERFASTGLSAVLLSRRGRYPRRTLFQELEKTGFDYILSIEPSPERYDMEELTGRFPFVRFILPGRPLSLGEQINLAAAELDSPLFFVLWNDLKIVSGGSARRMAERLILKPEEKKEIPAEGSAEERSAFRRLCTVPVIQNARFETLPTLIAPAVFRKKVRTIIYAPYDEGLPSLYPFDGVGIYDRERFIRIGGFDGTLKNTHWQFMDFGFRAHLWGEEICLGQQIKLSYEGEIPVENNTAEESYRRFYLKNIAPVFRGDHAHLPLRRFPGYLFKSGEELGAAWDTFSESREWVSGNKKRWRCDLETVTGRWNGVPPAETLFITHENTEFVEADRSGPAAGIQESPTC